MKSLYKSAEGKRAVLGLYDEQLSRIGCPFEDAYVDTAFGRTHVVVTGNPKAVPLLSFHGGNSTTAHNLITSPFLLRGDFRVFACFFCCGSGVFAGNRSFFEHFADFG